MKKEKLFKKNNGLFGKIDLGPNKLSIIIIILLLMLNVSILFSAFKPNNFYISVNCPGCEGSILDSLGQAGDGTIKYGVSGGSDILSDTDEASLGDQSQSFSGPGTSASIGTNASTNTSMTTPKKVGTVTVVPGETTPPFNGTV